MGCQIHFQNLQPICNTPRSKPTLFSSLSSLQTKHKKPHTSKIFASSSNNNLDQQRPISTNIVTQTQEPKRKNDVYNVGFRTLGGCKLGISRYPDFEYNAEGGEGTGTAMEVVKNGFNGDFSVDFDLEKLYIPPLTSATTRFLGLPLPLFLKIDIVPQFFQGSINQVSGKVELEFKAKFLFSAGNIYKAPPLMVETVLTTEESKGKIRSGRGTMLDENGRCRLVGVASVQPINDLFMNSFLSLPTECLADLNAVITFSST